MTQNMATRITAERRHQLTKGYDEAHDDSHWPGDLLYAALAYICVPGSQIWPFEPETYKPSDNPIENLAKAGALIAAEGDRLIRAALDGRPIASGLVVISRAADHMVQMVDGLQQDRHLLQSLKDPGQSA